MKLSSSLLEDGNYFEPDVITPNTVIQGLCKEGRLDEAVEIYDTMIERGSFGNLFTFHILIGEYIKAGIIDKAMEDVNQAGIIDKAMDSKPSRNSSCKPDIISFNIMTDGILKAGDIQSAKEDASTLYLFLVYKQAVKTWTDGRGRRCF